MIFPHVVLGELCVAGVWVLFRTTGGGFCSRVSGRTGMEPNPSRRCGSQFGRKEATV